MLHDFLVIGSGCTGAQAAQTLIESGGRVALLDVGEKDEHYAPLVPKEDFLRVRRTDPEQHRYFLGDRFEGVPMGSAKGGAQLTPPRQFVTRNAAMLAPFRDTEFKPVQSLARGGLGAAWGLGSHVFSDSELANCGLDRGGMFEAYETVSRRVGVSGARDDIAPFSLGGLQSLHEPLAIDENARFLLSAYEKRRRRLNESGFYLGRCPLALLGQDQGSREKSALRDMEFWSDHGRSAYRPWITLEELQRKPGFEYLPGRFALRFHETPDHIEVTVRRTDTGEREIVRCRRLLLATGALATARIVMRSFDYRRTRLPMVCNPFSYLASLNLRMLGRAGSELRHSLAQLVLFYAPEPAAPDHVMISIFSYRSLLLFRLAKDFPINYADGKEFLRFLQSALVLATINHADFPSDEKFVELVRNSEDPAGDALEGHYRPSAAEKDLIERKNRRIQRAFLKLGCVPAKRIDLDPGASIHYGGTLPFSTAEKEFHTAPDGRLYGTSRVFIADGSAFRYLPAKGPTLTFMAHAHRVARHALGLGN
ncbi:MAG: GMC oxidoreductase [Oligoflexia bacterium]|nr:GMC oxidoreductase [Oligoflexia bacterium]